MDKQSAAYDDLVELFLSGSKISKTESAALEQNLRSDPENFEYRVQLLGCYFVTVDSIDDRVRHLLWAISRLSDNPFMGREFCIVFRLQDENLYQLVKAAWLKNVAKPSASPQTFFNAVNALADSEISIAEQILEQARHRFSASECRKITDRIALSRHFDLTLQLGVAA